MSLIRCWRLQWLILLTQLDWERCPGNEQRAHNAGRASLEGRYKRQQCKAKVNDKWNPALKMGGPIKQAENPNATKAKEGARQRVQAPFFLNKYTWCHHCPWTSDASFFSPQYRLTPLALQRAHGKADLDWWGCFASLLLKLLASWAEQLCILCRCYSVFNNVSLFINQK